MNTSPLENTPDVPTDDPNNGESLPEIGVRIPDGGLQAWIVVLGGFINCFFIFGIMNSFSTFQGLYGLEPAPWPNADATEIGWIGFSQHIIYLTGGLITGPIFDKWGARKPLFAGVILCLLSTVGTGYSTKFWHYILTQGVFFGATGALILDPTACAITEWFSKRRSTALGVALSGAALGGVVWPFVILELLETLSLRQLHLVLAATTAPSVVIGCLLVRDRKGAAGHDNHGRPSKKSQRGAGKAIWDWRFILLCFSLLSLYTGILLPSSKITRFNIMSSMALLASLFVFSWIWMSSPAGQTAFALIFGMFGGGLSPLGYACLAQTTEDIGHIGLRFGFMMAICSVGYMGSAPLTDRILERTSWTGVHVFTGSVCFLGALCIITTRFCWQPKVWTRF
ncbi:hypothetical protein C2857_006081 [Epichloe festucae Fl1]|uniref:Major facilitator superfamily (MFS) profile domain-containing protein n=1 Tax=Epichloe festucae (strain Fl1) TaxID=877507 RepID=A0A7S9KPW1_EPIFF|nr:hypothetical protein C2857_006081 [Epichloe festucae Fl1]